ncbi:MAG: hypothetical protein ABL909_00670 [Sphingopyxis sp.]
MKNFSLSALLTAASFALAPLALLSLPTLAHAQAPSGDYRCTELPAQVRAAAAASTDAAALHRAQRFIANGQNLCNARAEGAAARQYRTALRILGATEVRPADARQMADTRAAPAGN